MFQVCWRKGGEGIEVPWKNIGGECIEIVGVLGRIASGSPGTEGGSGRKEEDGKQCVPVSKK